MSTTNPVEPVNIASSPGKRQEQTWRPQGPGPAPLHPLPLHFEPLLRFCADYEDSPKCLDYLNG